MDPVLHFVFGVAFTLLLLGGAWGKARDFTAFRFVLADYRILPASLVPATAAIVVVIETVLGFAWLTGAAREIVAMGTAQRTIFIKQWIVKLDSL